MQIPSYIEVITTYFPGVLASAQGPAYEDLITLPGSLQLPSKQDLDTKVLELSKSRMWDLIKAERDLRTSLGGSHVGNYWFHSDQPSRTQQIALVMLGANLPPGIMWKTMSGAFVPMTPTLAMQVFLGAVALDPAVFAVAENHRARMEASPTPWSYEYKTGWPLTYDESIGHVFPDET